MRTIRRDRATLLSCGMHVATRGVLKDIGPRVSHQGVAIEHGLNGREPVAVARAIHHSVQAVDRYLNDFRRVVCAVRQGFDEATICRMTRPSSSLVATYRSIYEAASTNPAHDDRWKEIELQLTPIARSNGDNPPTSNEKKYTLTLYSSSTATPTKTLLETM